MDYALCPLSKKKKTLTKYTSETVNNSKSCQMHENLFQFVPSMHIYSALIDYHD